MFLTFSGLSKNSAPKIAFSPFSLSDIRTVVQQDMFWLFSSWKRILTWLYPLIASLSWPVAVESVSWIGIISRLRFLAIDEWINELVAPVSIKHGISSWLLLIVTLAKNNFDPTE